MSVALLISYSEIHTDPRLRRQITWLTAAGWTVDTLGLGPHPAPEVRNHAELGPPSRWLASRLGTVVAFALLPSRTRFRLLYESRVPAELRERIGSGHYDLVVFNEYEFVPWVGDRRTFAGEARRTRLHLDLHEYHEPRRSPDSAWLRLTERHHRWTWRHIGHAAFASRTTVASRIAELYVHDFGFETPQIVRNAPPFVEQEPSAVDPDRVRLIFHGLASRGRGFDEILDALRLLDDRFEMTFMLMPNRDVIPELERKIADGLGDRARIVPPAPMTELSRVVNEYDLEILFYPPRTTNVELALPNKLFEAVQARLGLVTGESPMMAEILERYGNGLIVRGWTGADLADALAALTPERVRELKAASHRAASELNAEAEGEVFLNAVSTEAAR